MTKKKDINPDDWKIFQAAMKGTTPFTPKKNRIIKPPPVVHSRETLAENEASITIKFREHLSVPALASEEYVTFKQSALPHKILRKLRKGQYNVEAILDLHGMTIDMARTAVEEFLQECLLKKIRVVLIIHGKGGRCQGPILKNKLNHWLREIKMVLAFCSAVSAHGSRGAIYVLLKNVTEEIGVG